MGNNTGVPYELLTKKIFEQLVNQDEVETAKLKHNVSLKGNTTKHQVDVYWEFDRGGIRYVTIVQAKDWKQPVYQGELLAFKAVLDDLPLQATGIFVTRTGYQRGARDFAKANGIYLYELREPTEADWEGKVKTIIVTQIFFCPRSSNISFEYDNEWMGDERQKRGIPEDKLRKFQISGSTDEIIIYDENDQKTMTVQDAIDSLYFADFEEIPPTHKKHFFIKPAFIHTGIERFPRLKIKSLGATISVSKKKQKIKFNGEDIVGFILKNTLDESQYTFDKNRKLRE